MEINRSMTLQWFGAIILFFNELENLRITMLFKDFLRQLKDKTSTERSRSRTSITVIANLHYKSTNYFGNQLKNINL